MTVNQKQNGNKKIYAITFGIVVVFFVIGLLIGLFSKPNNCKPCPKCDECPKCSDNGICPNCPNCPACAANAVECPVCTNAQCPSTSPPQCPSTSPPKCPSTSPPQCPSTSQVVSVGVSTIQDLDNTSVNNNGALTNVIDNLSNTAWNPTRGGSTTYRLLFTLNRQAAIKYVIVNLTGDTAHDPTSLNIYTNSNKSTLLASVGDTMRGKNLIQIEIQNPVSTGQIYMEIGKTTQYQLYLNGVFFFA